ncbi:MAG: DnaD domain protein [Anaerolineae bacterium]|nr:DnaD domain protein [Anaerolineae bacterium]
MPSKRTGGKKVRPFAGFPAGNLKRIIVPEQFFSDLLPLIDDLNELKLTVYCLWALQQREGDHRYLRLRDVLADEVFTSGMGAAKDAEANVCAALARAVARGSLLEVMVPGPTGDEAIYFMNTDKGRRAVEALERGEWQPGNGAAVGLIASRPTIFALYEENFGPLTPLLSETLRDAEATYPYGWIQDAMRAAVENNKRSWRYVEAILRRWTTEGRPPPTPAKDNANGAPENDRYVQDQYFRRREDEK